MDDAPRKTALYNEHVALSAKMIDFAGYSLPVWYQGEGKGAIQEHLAVRNSVGIFDLSHMGEVYFQGEKAFDLLQFLLCNDLRKIGNGGCQYTLLPTDEGGVVDDLIIYQVNPQSYFAVVNAINVERDFHWFKKWNEERGYGVKIENRSYELSLIAVQGPRSEQVLEKSGFTNVHCILPFTFRQVKYKGIPLTLSATGYTGERGFEIILENDYAVQLWRSLLDAGKEFGAQTVGLAARDSLRLEAGLCLYGHELSESTSVLEASLKWAVGFGKEFIGKATLLKQEREGLKKLLFGLKTLENVGVPRQGSAVTNEAGETIGWVTSGVFSPVLKIPVAFCYLEPAFAREGSKVSVEVRGKRVSAVATKPPFVKHKLYEP